MENNSANEKTGRRSGKWAALNNKILEKNSLAATFVLIVIIIALMVVAYGRISAAVERRAIDRMEEGVRTVTQEVASKLARDSRVLNATADIISSADNFDIEDTMEIVERVSPLLDTMKIRILMPDDQILMPDGSISDASDNDAISFEEESQLGEHISDRVYSVSGDTPILRHFVPIVQNGEIAALLYGLTRLDELPDAINIKNIYNESSSVYIIDTKTGDFILDTWPGHDHLGNIADYEGLERKTKGEKSWEEFTTDMMALGSGYVIFRTAETGGWQYIYYSPAGINQWTIAVQVPEREAFTSAYAVRRVFIVVGSLMALAIAVYYVIVYFQAKRTAAQMVERAVLEEKLTKAEAAERAKSTFLSNMSHDIRTPMNAIIGYTTLAETNIDNKPRVQEYLAKILSSSNHLLSLINDVLDMSRIESGKLNIEERACSISDIFRDMRNIIQTQMRSKQINFYMDTLDVMDEDIYCDKLHLNQVLLNLLSNAIKFTPAGGSVSMMIRQKPGAPSGYGAYEIRVKDTGIGMSPEFAVHIFEPFERERNSTVSGIQGTGLGMAITKSIVDTMAGTIEVYTEKGKGTEFVLNFTFRLQSGKRQVSLIKELSGVRGLVVDDSFSTCDSVTKMLTQIGMRAEWTMRGQEAVLRARQALEMGDEFYAYVIDWALPDLSGLEVARQIRSMAGETVPIIILTAYDWTAFEEEAKEAGVTAFCNKPIFMSELRDTLLNILGAREDLPEKKEEPGPAEHCLGKRLLLVEDNELNREIAQELLEENGFEVDTAVNGQIAVDMVSNSQPGQYAAVLMDVQMPVMDGYTASKAIRALPDPALASVPIIAMTANAFNEDRKKAFESGMNDHIAKPFDINKLLKVLAAQLTKEET